MPAQEIIPSNIAKTADVQAIEALTEEVKVLNDMMLYFVTAMIDKLPRLDVADREAVNVETGTLTSVGTVSTVTGVTTVSTVTTVSGVTAVTNLNGLQNTPVALLPYQLGAGAFHIYNQIEVS
jgi:hypothetical protein